MPIDYKHLADKYAVSERAVEEIARSLRITHGRQAQFTHADLGGMGQWMPGMIMIGDAFNEPLKHKISALCQEIAVMIAAEDAPADTGETMTTGWWGEEFGTPAFTGSQNQMRYAYFPQRERLLVEVKGIRIVYSTTGYQLTGTSAAQNEVSQRLLFQTQKGQIITLDDLDVINSN